MKTQLTTLLPSWSGQHLIIAPPQYNPFVKSSFWDTCFRCPLIYALRFIAKLQYPVIPSVSSLLSRRCPSTVARFIIAVHIISINAVLRRGRFSHVGKKRLKAVSPSIANFNSPPAVVFPFFGRWVAASSFHVRPRPISFCPSHSMLFSGPRFFITQASARQCIARLESISPKSFFGSTVAPAIPARSRPCRSCEGYNRKPSKLLPRQVFDTLGRYNIFSHCLFTVGNWLGLDSCLPHGSRLSFNYTKTPAATTMEVLV